MPRESLARRWRRRALTIPAVVLGFVVTVASYPLVAVLAVAADLVRGAKSFSGLRLATFALSFFGTEIAGLLMLLGVCLTSVGQRRLALVYRVQALYTQLHFRAVSAIFSLRFECDDQALGASGPMLVLVRHASMIDTLVPAVFIANVYDVRLRYVLKAELLAEPCLDVAGQLLPNHFVRRGTRDAAEIAAVRDLKQGLGPKDGVLIFPEGTLFTPGARQRALEGPLQDRARELNHLLPIKPGGVLALLDAAPACDVVVVGHAGLEGFARPADIWRGGLVGRTIKVKFWRRPASDVPRDPDARLQWLHEWWKQVDRWLEATE
jgi:1-acyl-sn-glycerol-3-phosphate acyltransferase